jgi:predicted Zn-dependent protease
VLFSAALVYLSADQVSQARELAGELSKQIYPEALAYAKLVGGELSMARDDIPNAINLFQEARSQLDTWLGHFLLGRAYLAGGAFTEAYSEFETCLKRQGEAASVFLNDLPSFRYLPPVYYYLGRAQEGLESDAAATSYQRFLNIKEQNENDWMVEDARRRINSN